MISSADPSITTVGPTVWGLSAVQVHDRFWAARGVQVVRQGEPSEIVDDAELFLLTDARTLTVFKLTRAVDALSWLKPDVLAVRLHDSRDRGYRERVISGPDSRFLRFQRLYGGSDPRLARVALTPERRLAQLWQKAPDLRSAWRLLREEAPRSRRSVLSLAGRVYDRGEPAEVMQFLRELVQAWRSPASTIPGLVEHRSRVWAYESSQIEPGTTFVGPVWIGAGRRLNGQASIVGPQVLWDDPSARPAVDTLQWDQIEPAVNFARPIAPRRRAPLALLAKRAFDIVFAATALLLTLPLYPIVMIAIWLEDGRPFFFRHKRETLGGREFNCIKFRSMRKDAEQIKQQLAEQNQADGPQFFMDDDPRLTRVGRFIRRTYIDELPQFWNVLMGDMSVVGPRPSPFSENQFCPPWREARLSVKPGITGLWQVRRTRRQGLDFQEWIRYDIEYVQKASWLLDVRIILETIALVARRAFRP
jgi:lipopolysaccharide/colanic/teichoic acid biosynthesis glycosyltransferase